MTSRPYYILDVFTDRTYCGNPLALVLEAEGLSVAEMRVIATEFNISVTAFLFPGDEGADARLQIFTPDREIAFASQPTIGAGVLLANLGSSSTRIVRLRHDLGVVACSTERLGQGAGRAWFTFPGVPARVDARLDLHDCAAALGLEAADIGFRRHEPARFASSVTYNLVPVRSLEALARISPSETAFAQAFTSSARPYAYAYARTEGDSGLNLRARMFWPGPGLGLSEDPASASGAIALAASLLECEHLSDGTHQVKIEQGFEMGRPSEICVRLFVEGRRLAKLELGGAAVLVCEGRLHHPSGGVPVSAGSI